MHYVKYIYSSSKEIIIINDLWMLACNIERTESGVTFNDIYTQDGNLAVVTGIDCMKQLCAQSLWLWYGEWVMNNQIGVTYRRILGSTTNAEVLTQYQIENAITVNNQYIPARFLPKYGIKKVVINSFNLERSTRQLSVDVTIILNSNKKVQVNV